jgi:hypothetical protein
MSEEVEAEIARIIACADLKVAELIASAKIRIGVWQWIAGLLATVILTMVVTYSAMSKDYAAKTELSEVKQIVIENTRNLNRLIGVVETHVQIEKK